MANGDYLKAEIEYLNALRLEPGNALVTRQLGEVYFQQGNIPKSFIFLKRAADTGAIDDDLRIKLGRIYLTGRKFKEARDEANAVLQAKPDSDEALIIYSQAAVTSNDLREAAARLQTLRPRAEKSAGFHLALGTLDLRRDNIPAAYQAFQRAVALSPKLSVAHEMLAGVQFRQSNVTAGAQSLKLAAELAPLRSVTPLRYVDFLRDSGDEAGAMKRLEDIVQQAPDYLPASVQLAQMLFAARRNDDSAEVIKRILAMDPVNYEAMLLNGRLMLVKGEPATGLAELEKLARTHAGVPAAHYHLALAQLLNNDVNKAMTSLGQAINLDPDYPEALLLQAELNIRKGDAIPVITAMTDLVRRRPQIGKAYILLGDAHVLRNNPAEAMNVYARLAQLYPKNPEAYQLMGALHQRAGRKAEARQAFSKARELSPNYYPAFEQLVELDLAEKKWPAALALVQEEIRKQPKAAGPLVLQARIFLAQSNLPQAEVGLRKAIELNPDAAGAVTLLSRLLSDTGRAKDALATLRQAQAKNPKDPGLLLQIGMLEDAAANHAAARQAYEDALKINPGFWPALNNLAYLYSEKFHKLDQAYETARKARELRPTDPVVADTLGWILFKRREYGWALGMLQQSAQTLSAEPEVFYHLGMVQYMMGDEDGARASLTKATTLPKTYAARGDAEQRLRILKMDFSQADATTLAAMEKHLAENPGDPIVAGRLAALEEKKGDYPKALGLYERAIAANKGNVAAMARAARIYAERLNNPKKALELAKAARDASPEDPVMAHVLGAIANVTGDSTWAVGLLLESSRKLPDDPDVLHDLALAQYAVGQIPEAEATMQRAVGLGKPFPRLETGRRWLTISSLFKDSARLRQSANAVAEWLKADPSSPAVLMATGALHELQNNPAAAEQTYARVLALYPTFTPASLRLATLQAARPETLSKAFELATKLRQNLPEDPEVAALLGIIVYQRADYARAAQLLGESSRQRTADPLVWFYLGRTQQQLKKTDEARRALERFLALESSGERATEARRILGELK